ncbi:hypothetical protein DBR06_SOUSAS4810069 [Sousa chinensis]|nr:hypothetical protein DBR06_SOUSAS4810069 [Sousa chinensis]
MSYHVTLAGKEGKGTALRGHLREAGTCNMEVEGIMPMTWVGTCWAAVFARGLCLVLPSGRGELRAQDCLGLGVCCVSKSLLS